MLENYTIRSPKWSLLCGFKNLSSIIISAGEVIICLHHAFFVKSLHTHVSLTVSVLPMRELGLWCPTQWRVARKWQGSVWNIRLWGWLLCLQGDPLCRPLLRGSHWWHFTLQLKLDLWRQLLTFCSSQLTFIPEKKFFLKVWHIILSTFILQFCG